MRIIKWKNLFAILVKDVLIAILWIYLTIALNWSKFSLFYFLINTKDVIIFGVLSCQSVLEFIKFFVGTFVGKRSQSCFRSRDLHKCWMLSSNCLRWILFLRQKSCFCLRFFRLCCKPTSCVLLTHCGWMLLEHSRRTYWSWTELFGAW